ncbi:MAG: FdrA family protein [Streptosporangiaceae bacterium]
MTEWVEVRHGAYDDSVTLMRASRALRHLEGVRAALVAMATELNRDLIAGMGFAVPEGAGPTDLVVAVRAADERAVERARGELDRLRSKRPTPVGASGEPEPPRTVGSAARHGDATLALISVPGPYAYVEAADALAAGLSVLVFSDNVPVGQEIELKEEAARRGLIVMGPDCGTAVVSGLGLGFANVLRPGAVGVVAASGTGAQHLACLLDAAGVGVSHVLGTGGRDLSAEVAGRSTLMAMAALDADPATELVVVVSKPPAGEVAETVRAAARDMTTPTLFAPVGSGNEDLTAAAEHVLRALGRPVPAWPCWPAPQKPRAGSLRGLFSGGTLCDEAMGIAADALGPIRSNIPLRPEWMLDDDTRAAGHVMLDLGDDKLTAGRPHPMIDPALRLERLAAEARDPACGAVLLDVVLGHAADPDPARTLAPAVRDARRIAAGDGRDLAVVVSIIGTAGDPQGLDTQAAALRDAGAGVYLSNAAAARRAVSLVAGAERR